MEDKLYLTAADADSLSIPYDWKQSFERPFDMRRAIPEAQTLKPFITEDTQDQQIGLELLKMLLHFTFATPAQMKRLLLVKGIYDESRLEGILAHYIERKLLNRFSICVFPMDKNPDDALFIYCLDHSSRHILSHFYNADMAMMWKSTDALRSSELVSKYLATNDFYLSLMEEKGSALEYFDPTVNLSIRGRDFRMSASFRIANAPSEFLLDVIHPNDIPLLWSKKVGHIAQFINENHWKKHFSQMPTFLFMTKNLSQAEEMAKIFYNRTLKETSRPADAGVAVPMEGFDKFRIILGCGLDTGFEKTTFYKYRPEGEQSMVPVAIKLLKG